MKVKRHFLTLVSTTLICQLTFASKPKRTPEEESLYFLKHAKPIPSDQWETIAGAKFSEKYDIIKGDTLSDISKRLFGDQKYWPKIWSFNNQNITNPHKIVPGVIIAFSPGTGNTLPTVSIDSMSSSSKSKGKDSNSVSDVPNYSHRSKEWQFLPKQTWESFRIDTPPEVDPLGFDTSSKIIFKPPKGFDPTLIPATEKIPFLGQIVGSRSEGEYLLTGDTIYIRADEAIQVGETYAITQEPNIVDASKSDRIGYSYLILGKVKIVGVRDKLFIGNVETATYFIPRGSSLIPLPPKIPNLTPIPGPRPVRGIATVDRTFSIPIIVQHKEVIIDRGSEDGVKPGMIFRAYEHYDPSNDKKITNSDFIIDADIQVTQVAPTFCTGLVINFYSAIKDNSRVVLLTDISDLLKNKGFREKGDDTPPPESNDLDQLDDQDGLGKDEKRELKQLEKWKKNPINQMDTSPSAPDTTPPPPETKAPPPEAASPAENAPPPPPTAEAPQSSGPSELTPPPPAAGKSGEPSTPSAQENTAPPPPAEEKNSAPPPPAPSSETPPPPPPASEGEAPLPEPPPAALEAPPPG